MASNDVELQQKLVETGKSLLDPPSSIDELLNLLDKLERLLLDVEQTPSGSTQDSMLPAMKALISATLLRHSDEDIKVSVTSCLSEVTRITAPESPYNDEQMKEIFQLIVATFEKISNASGSQFKKAVSILENMARVRSCVVMLDLEMDELIVEMFQKFLEMIRPNHPDNIFFAMETIMTLVLKESEDIPVDLISPLLASLRKENQNTSPIAWKLGEKVMRNCAEQLKPYFKEAVEVLGIAMDEYAPVVGSIYRDEPLTPEQDRVNVSGQQMVHKDQSPDAASPQEKLQADEGFPKSSRINEIAPPEDADADADAVNNDNSSKVQGHCSLTQNSKRTDAEGNTEHEVKLEGEPTPETIPKKRGRKPNSLMNPDEGYDNSWICAGRKTTKVSRERKPREKRTDDLSTKAGEILGSSSLSPKQGLQGGSHPKKGRPKRKEIIMNEDADPSLLSSKEEALNVKVKDPQSNGANLTDPSLSLSKEKILIAEVKEKSRQIDDVSLMDPYQPLQKEEILSAEVKEKSPNHDDVGLMDPSQPLSKEESFSTEVKGKSIKHDDISLMKHSGRRCNSEVKRRKHLKMVEPLIKIAEETSPFPGSEKKTEVLNAIEEKPLHQSLKLKVRCINEDDLSVKVNIKKRSLVIGNSDEDAVNKKTKLSNMDGSYQEETPKTNLKRKHTPRKELASENPDFAEQLVGCKIKVWWPLDKTFYEGVVDSYDHIKKRHRVLYTDGDEEILNLKKQKWDLIGDDMLPEEVGSFSLGKETDLPKPETSSDTLPKGKGKAKSQSGKRPSAGSSSKSGGSTVYKTEASRSGKKKSADGATPEIAITIDELKLNPLMPDDGLEENDAEKSIGELERGRSSADVNSRETTLKIIPPNNNGGSPNSVNEFDVTGNPIIKQLLPKGNGKAKSESGKQPKIGSSSKSGISTISKTKAGRSGKKKSADGATPEIAITVDELKANPSNVGLDKNDAEKSIDELERGRSSADVNSRKTTLKMTPPDNNLGSPKGMNEFDETGSPISKQLLPKGKGKGKSPSGNRPKPGSSSKSGVSTISKTQASRSGKKSADGVTPEITIAVDEPKVNPLMPDDGLEENDAEKSFGELERGRSSADVNSRETTLEMIPPYNHGGSPNGVNEFDETGNPIIKLLIPKGKGKRKSLSGKRLKTGSSSKSTVTKIKAGRSGEKKSTDGATPEIAITVDKLNVDPLNDGLDENDAEKSIGELKRGRSNADFNSKETTQEMIPPDNNGGSPKGMNEFDETASFISKQLLPKGKGKGKPLSGKQPKTGSSSKSGISTVSKTKAGTSGKKKSADDANPEIAMTVDKLKEDPLNDGLDANDNEKSIGELERGRSSADVKSRETAPEMIPTYNNDGCPKGMTEFDETGCPISKQLLPKGKGKGKSLSGKRPKTGSSSKSGISTVSKTKAGRSGEKKSADGATPEIAITVDKLKVDPLNDCLDENDAEQSIGELERGKSSADVKSKETTPKMISAYNNDGSPKGINESDETGSPISKQLLPKGKGKGKSLSGKQPKTGSSLKSTVSKTKAGISGKKKSADGATPVIAILVDKLKFDPLNDGLDDNDAEKSISELERGRSSAEFNSRETTMEMITSNNNGGTPKGVNEFDETGNSINKHLLPKGEGKSKSQSAKRPKIGSSSESTVSKTKARKSGKKKSADGATPEIAITISELKVNPANDGLDENDAEKSIGELEIGRSNVDVNSMETTPEMIPPYNIGGRSEDVNEFDEASSPISKQV